MPASSRAGALPRAPKINEGAVRAGGDGEARGEREALVCLNLRVPGFPEVAGDIGQAHVEALVADGEAHVVDADTVLCVRLKPHAAARLFDAL